MEQINPYAVLRTTATHEAYKAYNRKATGQPWISLATLMVALGPVAAMSAQVFLHRPGDWLITFSCYLAPVVLAVVLMIMGGVRASRFRKANPMPEEWRQIPRIKITPAR